ncbi:formate/nitrite transporter family protein [Halomonas sp. WWR20]
MAQQSGSSSQKLEPKHERESPAEAVGVHKAIRKGGEKELTRTASALFWSAVAAGISISFSMVTMGLLRSHLPDGDTAFLVEALGYTVGFLVIGLAKQQLFTENTLTAVLPVMTSPSLRKLIGMLRLWSVVYVGNIIGVMVFAYALKTMPVLDNETREAFLSLGRDVMVNTPGEMFAKGIFAGWIIATMVWLMPAADQAKIWVIIIMTYLVALGEFTHIIVGSTEILFLVFHGEASWSEYLFHFMFPVLAGNVIGGTFIFALISHAQVRSDN